MHKFPQAKPVLGRRRGAGQSGIAQHAGRERADSVAGPGPGGTAGLVLPGSGPRSPSVVREGEAHARGGVIRWSPPAKDGLAFSKGQCSPDRSHWRSVKNADVTWQVWPRV